MSTIKKNSNEYPTTQTVKAKQTIYICMSIKFVRIIIIFRTNNPHAHVTNFSNAESPEIKINKIEELLTKHTTLMRSIDRSGVSSTHPHILNI